MGIINTKIIAHPMNWLTIFLMLVLAGIAGHLTLSWLGIEPKTATSGTGAPVSTGLVPASKAVTAIGNQGQPFVAYTAPEDQDGYVG